MEKQELHIDSIWYFSLKIYDNEDVKRTCLILQDTYGYDVLMLLACLFAAASGAPPMTDQGIQRVLEQTSPWRTDIIQPLRQIRRSLKDHSYLTATEEKEALRERVKTLEIEAERLALKALEPIFKGRGPILRETALSNARMNLDVYTRAAGIAPDRLSNDGLDTLVAALDRYIAAF